MHSAILWDNDGVLVNSEVLFYEANQRYFRQHGIELSVEHYFNCFLCSSAGAWPLLREKGWNDAQIAAARSERNAVYANILSSATDLAIPGIEEVLQHFSKMCRMAVVTSSDRDHFDQIHQQTTLLKHFELVIAAGDYLQEKPSPEPYLLAASRLGLAVQACIAVEDSPRGMQAALAAGMPCIALRSHLTATYPFSGAYAVVDTPAELRDALSGWYTTRSVA
jgi:HAD superfamily hydrolase (TIGR01509 family)